MKLIFVTRQTHLILGLIGLATVFFGSVTNSPFDGAELISHSDKLIHALAYGLLSLWFAQLLTPERYIYLGMALFFYGALIEWVQSQIPHRSASGLDMLANLTGIALALCFCVAVVKISSK